MWRSSFRTDHTGEILNRASVHSSDHHIVSVERSDHASYPISRFENLLKVNSLSDEIIFQVLSVWSGWNMCLSTRSSFILSFFLFYFFLFFSLPESCLKIKIPVEESNVLGRDSPRAISHLETLQHLWKFPASLSSRGVLTLPLSGECKVKSSAELRSGMTVTT